MALDARTRSSIYTKLVGVLGEQDANALMSQFPAIEADELVTKQFLRAELAELRAELRSEMADLATALRGEMHRQTLLLGSGLAAATALLASIGFFA